MPHLWSIYLVPVISIICFVSPVLKPLSYKSMSNHHLTPPPVQIALLQPQISHEGAK